VPVPGVKAAVMLCAPTGSAEVVRVAVPLVTVAGVPTGVPLSRNWTVPVAAAGETVAVKVAAVPCWPDAAEPATVVVVGVAVTIAPAFQVWASEKVTVPVMSSTAAPNAGLHWKSRL
jgi:hypothetical protein